MLLSKPQVTRFFRDWKLACDRQNWTRAAGWSAEQIENERYSLLQRAGFDSLTEVDPLAGFDRVLAELAALSQPANIEPQLRAQEQPLIRLRYACTAIAYKIGKVAPQAGHSYMTRIMVDKFRKTDLNDLTEQELTDLRNTLTARLGAIARRRKTESEVLATPSSSDPF